MVGRTKSDKQKKIELGAGLAIGGITGGVGTLGVIGKRVKNTVRTLKHIQGGKKLTQKYYQKNPKQYLNDYKITKAMAQQKGPFAEKAQQHLKHLERINLGIETVHTNEKNTYKHIYGIEAELEKLPTMKELNSQARKTINRPTNRIFTAHNKANELKYIMNKGKKRIDLIKKKEQIKKSPSSFLSKDLKKTSYIADVGPKQNKFSKAFDKIKKFAGKEVAEHPDWKKTLSNNFKDELTMAERRL